LIDKTGNVRVMLTTRRVRATIVVVERSKHCILWACISSHTYPVCNAHAPYCHLWPPRPYSILARYLIMDTIFGKKKKVTEHKMCFDFLYRLCQKHFSLQEEESEIW